LKHYPQVWRLRVHYVLLYWSLAALALFIAGYLVPLDYYQCENYWNLYKENLIWFIWIIILLSGLLFFINWRKKLRGFQQKSAFIWYITLYEILLYFFCFFIFNLVLSAFTYGLDLKKHKVFDKATTIVNSEIFISNNYFYPAYLPHFDSAKNELSDEYFRHGEQLYGVIQKRDISKSAPNHEELYSDALRFVAGILEAEAMTSSGICIDPSAAIAAWDSIRLWGYMPYALRNDFEQRLPHIPYLLAGMSFGDGLFFLEQARDTFTLSDADMVQIRRHYSDLNRTHFGYDKPEVGQGYHYKYFFGFDNRLFNHKCLLESLDSIERKAYHDYLTGLMKLDLYDNEYGLHAIMQADSNSKNRIFQTFRESSKYQLGDINQGLELLDKYILHLDSVSVFWYNKYTEIFWRERDREEMYNYSYWFDQYKNYYSNIVSELYPDHTDTNRVRKNKALAESIRPLYNRLRTEFPKVTDSLLFFYPNQTQLYLNDLSSFYYDRYLDYYFRKQNTEILDTLREYMAELGYPYPVNWNRLDDNSRKSLLSDAMSFSMSYPESKYNLFDSDTIYAALNDPSAFYLKVFDAVLVGILFFFFCNTDMEFNIRGLGLGIVFFTVVGRSGVEIYLILYPFLIFTSFTTIVLLLMLRHRTMLLGIVSQVMLMTGMLLLPTIEYHGPVSWIIHSMTGTLFLATGITDLGLLPNNHFADQIGKFYLLTFWCLLNIIIAILYRRHLTLPERS
jgi:hypothetical protein